MQKKDYLAPDEFKDLSERFTMLGVVGKGTYGYDRAQKSVEN
jgi:hypothetical protein